MAVDLDIFLNHDLSVFSTDNESVDVHDLTDGAGHGILVATDNIFVSCSISVGSVFVTQADAATGAASCNILYRFKEIALAEYIGIVQSQQQ